MQAVYVMWRDVFHRYAGRRAVLLSGEGAEAYFKSLSSGIGHIEPILNHYFLLLQRKCLV